MCPSGREDLWAARRARAAADPRYFVREAAAGNDPPGQSGGRKVAVPAIRPPKVDPKPTAASRNATGPCSEPATSSPRRATSEQSRAPSTARPSATPARPFVSSSSGKGGRRTTLSPPGVRPSTARGGPRFRAPPPAVGPRGREGRHGHGTEPAPALEQAARKSGCLHPHEGSEVSMAGSYSTDLGERVLAAVEAGAAAAGGGGGRAGGRAAAQGGWAGPGRGAAARGGGGGGRAGRAGGGV